MDIAIDHATDPGVHMPKAAKDSVYVTRLEYEGLIRQSAIDNYNPKKNIDNMVESQKEIMI